MPPPQHILASRLRGYVCRSCLLKILSPPKQKISWLSRHFAHSRQSLRSERDVQTFPNPKSTFKIFEEATDGTRTEVEGDDAEDEVLMEALDVTIRELEAKSGKALSPQLLEEGDNEIEYTEDDLTLDPTQISKRIANDSVDSKVFESMTSPNVAFLAQLRKLGIGRSEEMTPDNGKVIGPRYSYPI